MMQQGTVFRLPLFSFIAGTLIFLGTVGAILLGLVVLRRRLLPAQPPRVNLPPSGAQPWQRTRASSAHDDASFHDDDTAVMDTYHLSDKEPVMAFAPAQNGFPSPPTFASSSTNDVEPPLGFTVNADGWLMATTEMPPTNASDVPPPLSGSLPDNAHTSSPAYADVEGNEQPAEPQLAFTQEQASPVNSSRTSTVTATASTRPMRRPVKLRNIEQ